MRNPVIMTIKVTIPDTTLQLLLTSSLSIVMSLVENPALNCLRPTETVSEPNFNSLSPTSGGMYEYVYNYKRE